MAAAGRACARHRRAAVECPGPVTVRICDLLTDPRRCERPPAPSRPPARPTLRWRARLRPRAPASLAGGDSEDRGPEVVPPLLPCRRPRGRSRSSTGLLDRSSAPRSIPHRVPGLFDPADPDGDARQRQGDAASTTANSSASRWLASRARNATVSFSSPRASKAT